MFNDSDRDKLDALTQRIEKAEVSANPEAVQTAKVSSQTSRSIVRAVRLGSDFVALVMGMAFFGWLVDRQFGTMPWFMLGMILIGFCAGFWMIVRVLSKPEPEEDQTKDSETKE